MLADNARDTNNTTAMNTQRLAEPTCAWLANPMAFAASTIDANQVPPALRDWVAVAQSLTGALAAAAGTTPSVSVHYCGASALADWEAQMLHSASEIGFARQIQLAIHTRPLVVARTVLDQGGVAHNILNELGNQPLATLLFDSSDWQAAAGQRLLQTSDGLVGRARRWLHLPSSESIVVEEYFLEAPPRVR